MKHVEIQIRIKRDDGPEWVLSTAIDRHELGGVAREAAGLDGAAEWRHVEFFIREAVRTALLNWAEKDLPEVDALRSQRYQLYMCMAEGALIDHRAEFQKLESGAKLMFQSEDQQQAEVLRDAFAKFVHKHFGGYWREGEPNGPWEIRHLDIPDSVEARVAQLAQVRP